MESTNMKTIELEEDDVFCHFEGGKKGIQSRFGEQIQIALKRINGMDAGQLATQAELCDQEIPKICSGDFTVINRQLVEALADPLALDIEAGLGTIINFDEKALSKWEQRAKDEQFVSVGGASQECWDSSKSAKLLLVMQAVEKL
jgi:hypothetical protein